MREGTVLGIDPGSSRTGWGALRAEGRTLVLLNYGIIDASRIDVFPEKLRFISEEIGKLTKQYEPAAIAIEEPYYGSNPKALIKIGQVCGAIMATAFNSSAEIFFYSVLEVKQAVTGYGRAEKKQVQEMVKAILRMGDFPSPADAADALAVAICHQDRPGWVRGGEGKSD